MKHLKRILGGLALAAMLALTGTGNAVAADRFIILQSTTSTQNSGLFDYMLPIFTKKTGIEVRVVAVGTGQALKNARNGDGDVLFVHAKPAEEKFVAEGFGVKRQCRPGRRSGEGRRYEGRPGGPEDDRCRRRAIHLTRR